MAGPATGNKMMAHPHKSVRNTWNLQPTATPTNTQQQEQIKQLRDQAPQPMQDLASELFPEEMDDVHELMGVDVKHEDDWRIVR